MGGWTDVNSMGMSDPAAELMQFRIELNRRLRHALSNISASQITSGLNDLSGTLQLSKGGTGYSLAAPGGDRIFFYDLSENHSNFASLGVGLKFDGTTLEFDSSDDVVFNSVQAGTAKYGNVAGGNYAEFEGDGALKFNGDATVFNDLIIPLESAKTPASNAPTWATFNGNLYAYTFAVNDHVYLQATEVLHGYKEGSNIEFHVHWATNGSDGTDRAVNWEIEYSWADVNEVFPASATVSAETTITANTTSLTHKYTSVASISGTGYKLGSILKARLRRITSAGTAPANNPFGLMVGIHYELDTIGSRTTSSK
jgi:hypothetical protein